MQVGYSLTGLEGKVAVVTGAGRMRSIGHSIAIDLAKAGCDVAAVGSRRDPASFPEDEKAIGWRDVESVADEVRALGPAALALRADISIEEDVIALRDAVVSELGRVDIVVNNAGSGVGGLQWVVGDRDEGRETFELNFWSPLALIQELVPPMRDRGHGAVVNVTSIAQILAMGGLGHYNASKAALAMATETLRLELSGSGVQVLEVVAGPIATGMQGEARLVPGADELLKRAPLGKPDTLARLTVRALERGRKRLVYPRALAGAYNFPFAGRAYVAVGASRFAKRMTEADQELLSSVVRGGSSGDPMAQAARETWERRGHRKR